ncbi:acyl-CoA dehydrogenase family protein [Orrella marina]|nr:acyl-CoA dehydrogenase family protein [Orrella marina]
MTIEVMRFPSFREPEALRNFRREIRTFLDDQRALGLWAPKPSGWATFDPGFSKTLASQGWIGMTWPKAYGGHERSPIERHILTEELLAAGAPVRAHWVADRQSGPLLLRFGTDSQKERFLPRIAKGELYFCIGMSEPNSGSDLASIRTRATQVPGGWRINGSKIWTSNAHRVHMMILFARTGDAGKSRHEGVSQFLIDMQSPGLTIRPIRNMSGEHDFNEVFFDEVFVSDEDVVGQIGNGWKQVTSELVYERSGPDRWMSSIGLLNDLLEQASPNHNSVAQEEIGRLVAHLWTLHHMSLSVADLVRQGSMPTTQAALIKDLGTTFEQEIPEIARRLIPQSLRDDPASVGAFEQALAFVTLNAPVYSIRGGTREILRGMIAKSLGMR